MNRPLPDVDPGGAERLGPGHLGCLVLDRSEVDVEAVLHGLLLGDAEEEDVG